MFSSETLESVQCAISEDKHIVMCPLGLSCGHTICKKCIPQDQNTQILCIICNEINENNLARSKELSGIKSLIKQNLNALFSIVESKIKISYDEFKTMKRSFEEIVKLKMDFVREEIDVRIESLKNEIDLIGQDLYGELENFKEKLLKERTPMNDENFDALINELSHFPEYVEQPFNVKILNHSALKRDSNKSEAKLYEFQEAVLQMNHIIKNYSIFDDFKISFEPSDFKHEKKTIGRINCSLKNEQDDIISQSHLLKLIDEIQKENYQLKAEVSNLIDAIEALRDENLSIAVRFEEVNRQVISNETALWNADTKNQELLKDLNELTVEFENERLQKLNKIKELESKNSKLQCELIDSANKFEELQMSSQREIDCLNTKIDGLNATIDKLQDDIKHLSNESKNLLTELNASKIKPVRKESPSPKVTISDIAKIKDQIKSRRYRIIDLNVKPTDACVLPNGNLLVVSYNNNSILIMNKNMEIIRVIDKINNQPVSAYYATTNGKDRIYLSDFNNHRIIMTDLNLNFIKYSSGCIGSLNYPAGITYANDFIYLCDYYTKRIHRLTANLDQHTYFTLDIRPFQIKISNNFACVKGWNPESIRFYDINTFSLVNKYEGHGGDILELQSHFVEHSCQNKLFYIYNQKGIQIDQISSDGFNGLITSDNDNHGMTWFNGCLILTTRSSQKLIVV